MVLLDCQLHADVDLLGIKVLLLIVELVLKVFSFNFFLLGDILQSLDFFLEIIDFAHPEVVVVELFGIQEFLEGEDLIF